MPTQTNEDSTTQSQCAVCLEDLGSRNTTTLDCGHSFHYTCIFRWNRTHNNCPCCRQNINTDNSMVRHLNSEINPPNNIVDNSGGDIQSNNIEINDINNDINEINEINEINNANLPEILDMYTRNNYDVTIICNHCNHEIISCDDCGNNMCYCSQNRTTRNGVNPFHNIEAENEGNDPCYYCLDCFNKRDETLLDILIDDWNGDVFDREFIMEMYEKYYINNNPNIQEIDGYPSFNNYYDFRFYAEDLVSNANNNDFDEYDEIAEEYTQEEIDEINNENGIYNNIMNSIHEYNRIMT